MKYYLSRAGRQYGPYTLEDLRNMSAQGLIDAMNDVAWAEGMPSWVPVGEVLGGAAALVAQLPAAYSAPAQPYSPPGPQSGVPVYGGGAAAYGAAAAPAYNATYAPQPSAAGPIPPNLHWGVVLLLACVTGVFGLIWVFIQANFVKKIDPASTARKLYGVAMLAFPAALVLFFVLVFGVSPAGRALIMAPAGLILFAGYFVALACIITGHFSMRRSIQNYYNTVEPIGLRLDGVMTFFFNILYFQYHFSRIANWKTTGRLY